MSNDNHAKAKRRLELMRRYTRAKSPKKIYLYSMIVGILGGLVALLFNYVLEFFTGIFLHHLAAFDPGSPAGESSSSHKNWAKQINYWWLFFLPAIGALVAGLIIQYLSPESKGPGTNAVIDGFHDHNGKVRPRSPVFKALATLAILSTGGSGGKEGPISQIGTGIGSLLARFLGLGPKAQRTLYLAGMAGALGALFRAPLGAAITAVEVLYREDFESDSLIPCILSSISGYFVFTAFYGFSHLFKIPEYSFSNWKELIFYTVLGLLCFLFGFVFVKLHNIISKKFDELKLPLFIRITIGGLLVGVISLVSLESLGSGFGFLQKLMLGEPVGGHSMFAIFDESTIFSQSNITKLLFFLIVTFFLKMLATIFTVGSGGSGGFFAPSLVLGGILGAIVGVTAKYFFPEITTSAIPFIVVGMGAFFAGVANAPIASVIMVTEITGSYSLLAPLLVVSIFSLILSHRWHIYPAQRQNKFESPAHEWDMTKDFLTGIFAKDIIYTPKNLCILQQDLLSRKLFKIADQKHQTDFVIANKENFYIGFLSLRHLSHNVKEGLKKRKGTIESLTNYDIPPASLEHNLSLVLEKLITYDIDKIAVVDEENHIAGYLTFRDVLRAYRKKTTKFVKAKS